ncbi:unnamed protein product, partial [marine sediment metagenome]
EFALENVLANVLVLKDRIRDIFENSSSQDEACEKKNKLYFEGWHKKNHHFKKIIKLFITVPTCEYMFTYLKEPDVPRSGNSVKPTTFVPDYVQKLQRLASYRRSLVSNLTQ